MKVRAPLVATVCGAAVVASAVGVVYAKYTSRKYFVELERLREARYAVDEEWGRLQLEQGTQATHWRIESQARKQLQMGSPASDQVIVIAPRP